MSALTCTCRTKRSTAAVEVEPCAWHRAYRKAQRGQRLGPDEISRIRRAAWARKRGLDARVRVLEAQVASLQVSAPRGIP